ncbi:MAG TPA: DUF4147 domain-containing protein [Thermomicrobiales bacterium]|nr:DUF4147 domain-containing protein [Thermomicrobiales bacterium]
MVDLSTRVGCRALIEEAYANGVDAVAPGPAVERVLSRTREGIAIGDTELPVRGSLVVVAIGKAAPPMTATAAEILGDRVDLGYVLTKDGHIADPIPGFQSWEASHPVPDQRGIDATRAILDGVAGLGKADVVLALISGGGSALFEAPVDGLTLDDIQKTTDLLLRAGAPIQHLNAVRSELSQVKGGGFRRRIGEARVVSLILSDVLGNSPGVIASGPTVRREPDPETALHLLEKYDLLVRVPEDVRGHLERARRDDRESLLDTADDLFRIIGDNERFVSEIGRYFQDKGLKVERVWHEREGEARDQALEWVSAFERTEADVILGGGELTVKVRGDGTGGRNTEFVLAAAIELSERGLTGTIASLASDGQDGAIDAAGAIVDRHTVDDLEREGVDPVDALERNDSGTVLSRVDALLAPGPTGTNVNDVYIGLRHGE